MRWKLLTISSILAILFLSLLMTSVSGSMPAAGQSQEIDTSQNPGVSEFVSNESGLSFRLNTPAPSLDNDGSLSVQGLNDLTRSPDLPELPYYTTLIVLPPEAEANVRLKTENTGTLQGVQVQNAPRATFAGGYQPDEESSLSPSGFVEAAGPITGAQAINGEYPAEQFDLSEPFYVRDLRLARLTLYPVRYDLTSEALSYSSQVEVNISFDGANFSGRRLAPTHDDQLANSLTSQILNGDQVRAFRSLPPGPPAPGTSLPIGTETFKIEIKQDGIYELTYADLEAAGMQVGSVDPQTFEMNYRGGPVAYEFIGDDDNSFESSEKIRFYGWAFNGSRLERQFITNNVFWLWAGGSPTTITGIDSLAGGTPVTEFLSSVTREEENHYISIYTNWKDSYPNEADSWYWDRVPPISRFARYGTYTMTLNNPADSGPDAQFTAEFSTRDASTTNSVGFTTTITMNNYFESSTGNWLYENNANITGSVPINTLINGTNNFDVSYMSTQWSAADAKCLPCTALNRITVDYLRKLIASDNQLIFSADNGGPKEFQVQNFLQNQPIIWDISQRTFPISITQSTIDVSGGGPYAFTFGSSQPAGSKFIAISEQNTLSPLTISKYIPADLNPTSGGADWVAISNPDFLSQVQVLADHRSSSIHGGLSTHVISVEDVINQYGYGLPIPAAIKDYLKYALENWNTPPTFALLVGDSTQDPRHLNPDWTDEQFMLSDMVHIDPWQGEIPSDLVFSLLSDDDLAPDIYLGRIAAQTADHVATAVSKIIRYDQNQLQSYGWMENIVFVSDNPGAAGNFCLQNQWQADKLPDSFKTIPFCRENYSDVDGLRADIFQAMNNTGATIINYRGHGATDNWGGSILTTSDVDNFTNTQRPFVIITGNCLDGKYNNPEKQGLGETLLRAKNAQGIGVGAAAHFGSTGLGLSSEHSAIIGAFYDELFNQGITTIGGATTYAKIYYGSLPGAYDSLIYSYVVGGDPAMQLFRPNLSLAHSANTAAAAPGEEVRYQLDISNFGVYPSHASVEHLLPDGFHFITATSSIEVDIKDDGNPLQFDIQFGEGLRNKGIPRNETATVVITAFITPTISLGAKSADASVTGTGLDYVPGNEQDQAEVMVLNRAAWLPILLK